MKGENMKKIKAWYFSGVDCRLRYEDDRPIVTGETHTVDCKPILCKSGLHGSIRPLDAIQYAPGPVVWRVELSGDMDVGDDKIAATERKYLWGYDATDILRSFARECALDVVHLWDAPEAVVLYLKTGDESLRAAALAAALASALDAAWAAAWAAALDVAWAAAWAAASDAALDAARAAASDAALDAALDAARAAAIKKQNRLLYRMIMDGRKKAI